MQDAEILSQIFLIAQADVIIANNAACIRAWYIYILQVHWHAFASMPIYVFMVILSFIIHVVLYCAGSADTANNMHACNV